MAEKRGKIISKKILPGQRLGFLCNTKKVLKLIHNITILIILVLKVAQKCISSAL